MANEIKEKLKDIPQQEQEANISESRYNIVYKNPRQCKHHSIREKEGKKKKM